MLPLSGICWGLSARPPGALPGAGRWTVAAQDLGLVLIPGGGGAVGSEDEGPALAVDGDLVVIPAKQDAVGEAGAAAVGFVTDMVDFTDGGRLAAARPAAVPVAVPDQVPDGGGDRRGDAEVQGQAGTGQPAVQLPATDEGG